MLTSGDGRKGYFGWKSILKERYGSKNPSPLGLFDEKGPFQFGRSLNT
jgi:hypothetical protein